MNNDGSNFDGMEKKMFVDEQIEKKSELQENVDDSIDDNSEENEEVKENQQLESDLEKIDQYKKQVEKDNEDYNSEYEGYKKWCESLYKMGSKFIEVSTQINEIIEELKVSIDSEIDTLSDEEKADVENRAKGINIIGKMFNNTVEKNIDKTKVEETVEKQELNKLEDEDLSSEDAITEKLNENYNLISQMKNNKQSVISDYFDFINSYILPINDGVLSGIQYINLVEKEEINRLVLPTYIKLKEKLEELLDSLGVTEIKIEEFDPLDYAKIEVFDVEETDDEKRNETIHEAIRTGYTYDEDLYGTGDNHVVRTAQVTVYKYVEDSKAVDQDEI